MKQKERTGFLGKWQNYSLGLGRFYNKPEHNLFGHMADTEFPIKRRKK